MIRFNAVEKIVDQVKVSLHLITGSKKLIKNKNSPNYGMQIVTDTLINKTALPNKTNADIRSLEVVDIGNRHYSARAIYSDGTAEENFVGHWYGLQHGGRGPVWTPMGRNSTVDLGQKTRFVELSVWIREQNDDKNVETNTHGTMSIGDAPW